jgi:hypothetical protein
MCSLRLAETLRGAGKTQRGTLVLQATIRMIGEATHMSCEERMKAMVELSKIVGEAVSAPDPSKALAEAGDGRSGRRNLASSAAP